jgi:hypothetical protein
VPLRSGVANRILTVIVGHNHNERRHAKHGLQPGVAVAGTEFWKDRDLN